MIHAKEYVCNALVASSALTTYLGSSGKILFEYPDDFTTLPVLTYMEFDQSDADRFDDSVYASNVKIQIDLWVSRDIAGTTTALADIVDPIMQGLKFNLDYSADVPDPNRDILHKVMRYSSKLSADDIDAL